MKWLKTEEPDFDFLSFEEAARFLDAAEREPEWYAMMLTAMRTGLRIGDACPFRYSERSRSPEAESPNDPYGDGQQ